MGLAPAIRLQPDSDSCVHGRPAMIVVVVIKKRKNCRRGQTVGGRKKSPYSFWLFFINKNKSGHFQVSIRTVFDEESDVHLKDKELRRQEVNS